MATGENNGINNTAIVNALQNRTLQIIVGAVVLIIIIAIAILFFVNAGKNLGVYKNLVSGVDQGRALEIAAQLKNAGLEAEIVANETGGSSVQVREKQYDSAVLEMARSDLLVDDDFKLFDKTDWAASDYEKRVKYMRAIGGETSRLLSRMEGIKWAKVHVTIPPEKLFSSIHEQNKTSASVTLELEPGRVLSNNQVASILSLVSGYVPELEANRISIVDTKGRVYSSATLTNDEFSFNNNYNGLNGSFVAINADIERRIQNYLDGLVGAGKSRVAVSTQIISDKITRNKTTFFPGAIGTHEYSEEALGDAAKSPAYTGESFPAPPPKEIDLNVNNTNINYQSDGYDMTDPRLKKDMTPSMMSGQQYNTQYNLKNAPPNNQNTRYICAENDEACKRNYRRHNFSIHSYPSYEQVMTESVPGTIKSIKVSVIMERGNIPVSLGELKSGIAAAAHPNMTADDVQIVFGNPPPPPIETKTEKKGFFDTEKYGGEGFPFMKWLLILFGALLVIWIIAQVLSAISPKRKKEENTINNNTINRNTTYPQQTQAPVYSPTPTQPPLTLPPQTQAPALDEEIPFDLEDEFSVETKTQTNNSNQPRINNNSNNPSNRRRNKITIDDD